MTAVAAVHGVMKVNTTSVIRFPTAENGCLLVAAWTNTNETVFVQCHQHPRWINLVAIDPGRNACTHFVLLKSCISKIKPLVNSYSGNSRD
jgi:hypothetical protein